MDSLSSYKAALSRTLCFFRSWNTRAERRRRELIALSLMTQVRLCGIYGRVLRWGAPCVCLLPTSTGRAPRSDVGARPVATYMQGAPHIESLTFNDCFSFFFIDDEQPAEREREAEPLGDGRVG